MYLSIEEAYEAVITRKQVIETLKEHGYDPKDFFAECGDRDTYTGKVVLDWMGY